ncbi:GntR family transcriptional regulator [Salmonella enterica subsp. enterica serovar Typhi]|nr:GntR family transcriptional regulator [Salmonella enterica subsp. enterica serovar Typhi]
MSENGGKKRTVGLAERIYHELKNDIFDFRLMPGAHFSENEISERMSASRTPVRQALFWLEHEGYVQVYSRSGWQVKPFDFNYFEALYDFRIVLEREAVRRLCGMPPGICSEHLAPLVNFWIASARMEPSKALSLQDEQFHTTLVRASGNSEMARVHVELTEKMRIIRHLDFTRDDRVDATYNEHACVLQQTEEAQRILTEHISQSKAEVRKITLHMLQQASLQPVSP